MVSSRVVKNDFLLRISIVRLQLRCSRRKNLQRISVDTPPVFSSSPPRFVKTLKMLTTEPFFTTLLALVSKKSPYETLLDHHHEPFQIVPFGMKDARWMARRLMQGFDNPHETPSLHSRSHHRVAK